MFTTFHPTRPWSHVSSGKFSFKRIIPILVAVALVFSFAIWQQSDRLSIVPTAVNPKIMIYSPMEYQLFQRGDSGDNLDRADIPIRFQLSIGASGQYKVLARWNGSEWQEVDVLQTDGNIAVAMLPDQPVGQGDFELKIPELNLAKTVKTVSVGDLYFICGQSNAVGCFGQRHLYLNKKVKCSAYDFQAKSWKIADDPINYFHRETERGSVWPLVVARLVEQNGGVPIGLADFSIVGTRLVKATEANRTHLPGLDWQPEHGCYQNLICGIKETTDGTCRFKAVLFFGGESDAWIGVPREKYKTELKKIADSLCSDLGLDDIRIIVAQIGNIGGKKIRVLENYVTDIQQAQREIVDNQTFFSGPDGRQLPLSEGLHFTDEESAHKLAQIWVDSILAMEKTEKEKREAEQQLAQR